MRSIIFSILFLIVPKLAISQIATNDKTVYLDSLWNETKERNHKYYRIIKDYYTEKDSYKIRDYYKSGILQMEGSSKTKDGLLKEGEFIYYYENGNKKSITNYIDDGRRGKYFCFYENGNLKEEGEYIDNYDDPGRLSKINQFWDENNNHTIVDGNGNYFIKDKDHSETGTYKNGYKDGIYEGKNFIDNSSYSEKYEYGKFLSGIRTFADNTKTQYFEITKNPHPKNGIRDFYAFIGQNFNQGNNNIPGKILIQFVVDPEGQITETTILKGLTSRLNSEAIRVLLKYGNWIPGEERGEKVKCKFIIPIVIQ